MKVLWVDDQGDEALWTLLREHDCHVHWAATGAEGLHRAGTTAYDVIVLDVRLDDMSGLTVLRRLMSNPATAPILVVTGHYFDQETLHDAFRFGATAVAYKPFLEADELAAALRAIAFRDGQSPLLRTREDLLSNHRAAARVQRSTSDVIAASGVMRGILDWVDQASACDAAVLLTGETGVGKEVVANAIHSRSRRQHHAFVPVNCGALPEALFESELFGHSQGAFTGAVREHRGLIDAAQGGTVFLDEIGDMPLAVQGHLLRFLECGEVRKLGGTKIGHADVRVIAATNRVLLDDVARGRFCEDLYFRLAVLLQHIPPLRERREDVEAIVLSWFPELAQRHGRFLHLSPDALVALCAHNWPGNVRELRNVLERAICQTSSDSVTARDITQALLPRSPSERASKTTPPDIQRTLTLLEEHHGNQTCAARALGVNRTTLWRRLRRYNADCDRKAR